jgi:hypothetical protein
MTNWTTDEDGNRDFRHGRWCVRIWNKECPWRRIEVTTDSDCADVVIEAEGMWVNGVTHGSWHDVPHAFTIPWEVIAAVVEARAIIG